MHRARCLALAPAFFFFFNDTATTEIYTLSLHDALPISLRILWNEIIGFIFLVLAGWMVPGTIRSVRQLNSPDGSIFRVLMFIGFGLLLAYFGITSFLRARKISRS